MPSQSAIGREMRPSQQTASPPQNTNLGAAAFQQQLATMQLSPGQPAIPCAIASPHIPHPFVRNAACGYDDFDHHLRPHNAKSGPIGPCTGSVWEIERQRGARCFMTANEINATYTFVKIDNRNRMIYRATGNNPETQSTGTIKILNMVSPSACPNSFIETHHADHDTPACTKLDWFWCDGKPEHGQQIGAIADYYTHFGGV